MRAFDGLTRFMTNFSARVTLWAKPEQKAKSPQELANAWKNLMPDDGQEFFPIKEVDERTAEVEIHLHCPLRGSGDPQACYKLMNYDRKLIESLGAHLVVLESQSNSGKNFCRLAIRSLEESVADLIPAHEKVKDSDA
jgi:hypothetical protein